MTRKNTDPGLFRILGNRSTPKPDLKKTTSTPVDSAYLCSWPAVADQTRAASQPFEGKIILKPGPLLGTDLNLSFTHVASKTQDNKTNLQIEIVDDSGVTAFGLDTTMEYLWIRYREDQVLVTNNIYNRSGENNRGRQPVRNLSGILAPYEDALLYQIAANERKNVVFRIQTSMGVDTRFIKNYLERGFVLKENDDPTGEHPTRDLVKIYQYNTVK